MLEDKAKRLIELKEEYDRLKDEYMRLMDEFHNELLESGNKDFEFHGYRISLLEDTIRRELERALLKRTLKELGLSEDEIISVIISSKREIPLSGIINITKV
ncbi:MAG: hypothetical protein HF314_02295 [Ignavibacteria bacterium]|jgi:hypothetical protein|nr:hypothetical protein [Ignavibacteria bacterium]MCU7501876.1 hypothetical protein [Ignavibacteria bacterium]